MNFVRLLCSHWDSSLELVDVIQERLETILGCLNDHLKIQDKLVFSVDGPSFEAKVYVGSFSSH